MLEDPATIVRLHIAAIEVAVGVQTKGEVFLDRNAILVNVGPLGMFSIPVPTLRARIASIHGALLVVVPVFWKYISMYDAEVRPIW